jgi:elongation factor G
MGQVRNICLVGHAGSGKTTLAASLLKKGGIKDQIIFDASQEEKDRGYSIDMGFGSYDAKGTQITLIDTPGGDEFIEEMYKAIPVSDLSLIVVNGEKGIEVMTERAWELTGAAHRPTAVFVNHLDKEGVEFPTLITSLREHLDGKFVPLDLPIREGGAFVGVVDLLANRAFYFADKSKKAIPPDLEAAVEEWRGFLLEEVSSLDDDLMMKFLEEEEITASELASALAKGVADGTLIPILWGAASEEKGIDRLMETFTRLVPGSGKASDAPCKAVVFNLSVDPYLGRLTYVRVLQGTIKEGETCYLLPEGHHHKVEIRDLYAFDGTKQKRVPQAEPGMIVAIGKVEGLPLGATISAQADDEPFPFPAFPQPVYSRMILPKSQSDVEKMSGALKELASTKATVKFERDPVTKEMILWGMGDTHLSFIIERLKNRYNVALETHRPRIPYKETIRKKAIAKYRHKKQSGGRGQFGEVVLRIEPLKDEEFKFIDEIKGAAIPGQYIPGVEKGVREAMEEGNLAKYPVTNVAVAVFDGGFHPVDSSELAFKLAARNAFRMAFDDASPCLLEPVMALEVKVPEDYTGDVISDLNGRRGRILGMEPSGRVTTVRAEVPLIEVQSYALDLKSLTQARATFQMEFLKYQQVPANLQEKIIAQTKEKTE